VKQLLVNLQTELEPVPQEQVPEQARVPQVQVQQQVLQEQVPPQEPEQVRVPREQAQVPLQVQILARLRPLLQLQLHMMFR
jgi:hypothetical protein